MSTSFPAIPRIAIAGFAIESSTFSPHRADFRDFPIVTGDALVNRYASIAPGTELRDAARWLPVLGARAIPGGPVLANVYTSIRTQILDGLAALLADGPLDGVFLDIHGAMSVDGMDDAEGDFVSAVRELVGPDTVISAAMDLHGNVTQPLLDAVNLITCFRLAPHEDAWETRDRAIINLVTALREGRTPLKAWVRVPILLPGEKTSTRVEPAKSLYERIPAIEALPEVVDAAIWVGYAWADEPRCNATVVVTGYDRDVIAARAHELARAFWDVRDEFEFVGPPGTLAEAVDAALASDTHPYLISDSGDNPGAGGTGDVTWTLTQLLADERLTSEDSPITLCASVFDRDALDVLSRSPLGETVDIEVGARVDHGPAGPARVVGVLHSLHSGDPAAGRIAVIRVGGLHVIVTEFRKAYHAVTDFTAIGLSPKDAQIVVTKIGYLEPELYDVQRGWTLALTPGGVDQNLERLGHHRIDRPMFPFDTFDHEPALEAVILP
ncbi:M81 family peptidase [Mycetocola tolaasinivorans]|uniref:M81 family peptidase n=1 Tax=Mycetocola tolaasinivorans TaxID=76635 RepID=A0A3L7A9L9_9MICO|nr:M81 family metallopeptidase [Mycetocola tolaasinivorans]RLP76072.1 M81 family peptidase [Mycetocola tolaasinivorans]